MTFKKLISASVLVLGAQFMGGSAFASDVVEQPTGEEVVTVASPKAVSLTTQEATAPVEEVTAAPSSPVSEVAAEEAAAPAIAPVVEEEVTKVATPKAEVVTDEDALPDLVGADGAVAANTVRDESAPQSAASSLTLLQLAAFLEQTNADYAALKAKFDTETNTRNQVIALIKQLASAL